MRPRRLVLALALLLGACSNDADDHVRPTSVPSAPTTVRTPTPPPPGPPAGTIRAALTEIHDFPGPPDKGSVVLTLRRAQPQICYEVTLRETDRATEVHIHEGTGIAATLTPNLGTPGQTRGGPNDGRGGYATAQGCQPVPASLVGRLLDDPPGFSVDIHTATAPTGAVQGRFAR